MVATPLLVVVAQVLYTDPSFHRTNTSCEISWKSSHGEHSAPHIDDVHLHMMQLGIQQVYFPCRICLSLCTVSSDAHAKCEPSFQT